MVSLRQCLNMRLKPHYGSIDARMGFIESFRGGFDSMRPNGAKKIDVCGCQLYANLSSSVYRRNSAGWSFTYVSSAAKKDCFYLSTCPLVWGL